MRAADLIAMVEYDPERTGAAWRATGNHLPRGVDPAELLLLAQQHRVAGLLLDALVAAEWLDQLPVSVREQLGLWTRTTEARQRELSAALSELADREPEAVSRSVLLKGATLYRRYRKPSHRPMNDFDILLSADDFAILEPHFEQLGYWRKESLNGPTYYRESDSPLGRLCMDVHVCGPSKYYRPDEALTMDWLDRAVAYEIDGVACRRPAADFTFVNVVTHLHEHLASWIHALADDDIRLIRFLDAELLVDQGDVDPVACWHRAAGLDLHGEFALGLWAWARVRGALPRALAPLRMAVDMVDPAGELCAMPYGETGRWPVPLRERAFRADRLNIAMDMLPADAPRGWESWEKWYATTGMLPDQREDVEAVGARARDLLAGFEV